MNEPLASRIALEDELSALLGAVHFGVCAWEDGRGPGPRYRVGVSVVGRLGVIRLELGSGDTWHAARAEAVALLRAHGPARALTFRVR